MKIFFSLFLLVEYIVTFQLTEYQLSDETQLKDLFKQYQNLNHKNYYSPEEQNYRFQVFTENAKFLFKDFNNLNDKVKIKEKEGQKIMVLSNHNPCQEELALNDFMDYSNQEFSNNYLLQPDFFNTNVYNSSNEIYKNGVDDFTGFSYNENPEWITNEIDSVLQNPNFDIFDETLKFRQNKLKLEQPKYDYQDHQMHNDLLGFTKYDDKYYQQQIKMFLYDIMPNYNTNLNKKNTQEDQEDTKLQNECYKYMKQQKGRRLQYEDFNMDSFWNKYYDQLTNDIVNNFQQDQQNTQQNIFESNFNNQIQDSYNFFNDQEIQNKVDQQNEILQYKRTIEEAYQKNQAKQKQINQDIQKEQFKVDQQTKVYKTNTQPPKYIAVSQGKIKTFDYNPKIKQKEDEEIRKQRLIQQIKQMLQKNQNTKQNQQKKNNTIEVKVESKQNKKVQNSNKVDTILIEGVELPRYVNWQEQTQFTPVKNQQKCNACYAFGALATLEAHISLKFNKQISLSEQEILDCSSGNQGCNGGQPYLVYDYIQQYGVNLQKDYPYIARQQYCRRQMDKYRYKQISGKIFVKPGMINLLKAVNFGPVAVVSHASDFLKYFYDGTFTGRGCYNKKTPNHASMLYGYNLNAPQPYLLFKNNWGLSWGNRGYYKVTIGELSNNNLGHCLIAETTFNVIPIIQQLIIYLSSFIIFKQKIQFFKYHQSCHSMRGNSHIICRKSNPQSSNTFS